MPRIPPELMARPFSLDEARAAGLTLSALRGKAWRRLGSKLYCASRSPDNPWRLLEACHQMLPAGAMFVGRTAAWIHRLGLDANRPIEIGVPVGSSLRSRSGVSVRQIDARGEIVVIKGLRVTTLQRTLLDLCAREPAVEALIALDSAKRMKLRWTAEIKGRPGAARLRRLTALAPRAESPMETRLRWLLVSSGLPAPEVQVDLSDNDGRFVARADLYYPAARMVIEFDGGNHRERLVSDDRRQNLLIGTGFGVLRFTAADLYTRPDLVVAQVSGSLSKPHSARFVRVGLNPLA